MLKFQKEMKHDFFYWYSTLRGVDSKMNNKDYREK